MRFEGLLDRQTRGEIEPSLDTSAAVSQSPITPWSSMLAAMTIVLPEECGSEKAAVRPRPVDAARAGAVGRDRSASD
jgi:hypothetical protein